MQLVVWHWVSVVWLRQPAPGLALVLGCALLLVAANALAVPALRRARRRQGWAGQARALLHEHGRRDAARRHRGAGVWLTFGLVAGLLGAVGAGASLAFEAFRAAARRWPARSRGCWSGASASVRRGSRARACASRSRVSPPALAACAWCRSAICTSATGCEGERLTRMVERDQRARARPDRDHRRHLRFRSRVHRRWPAAARASCARAAASTRSSATTTSTPEPSTWSRLRRAGARRSGCCATRSCGCRCPERLYLAGIEDPGPDWSARRLELPALERLAAERPGDGPTLLLVHRPEAFPQAARARLSARARRPHPRRPARAARRPAGPGTWRASSRASRAGVISWAARRST